MDNTTHWTSIHSLKLFAILAIQIGGVAWASYSGHPLVAWLISLSTLVAMLVVAGDGVTGYARGILIDSRNVISLSRFQMVIWTVLVLSTYLAGAFCNLAIGNDDPLRIAIPAQLWILMGISTTSLVASPLILSPKTDKTPSSEEKDKTFKQLSFQGDSNDSLDTNGLVVVNKSAKNARWSDMLTGEETGNAFHLDLSRVQMLFFTVIVSLVYGIAIANTFVYSGSNGIVAMPSLDESMLSLIAISHGGYLVSKGMPNSKTTAGK